MFNIVQRYETLKIQCTVFVKEYAYGSLCLMAKPHNSESEKVLQISNCQLTMCASSYITEYLLTSWNP